MICGKICSGKTVYSRQICRENNAVILSVDEIMLGLFGMYAGDRHDEYAEKIQKYLFKKSVEIIGSGVSVILDWGFWTKEKRVEAREFYRSRNIPFVLYYIDVCSEVWKERIANRNRSASEGETEAYIIDNNLAAKFERLFEPPEDHEIDIRVKF
ncbi:MAG: ATP-binding protein [Ruminococcus sp.]|nr:ATP-binding protein [Ruminococcus sp.]